MSNVSASEYQGFRLWAGITSITLNTALGCGLYLIAPRIEGTLNFLPFALQLAIVIEIGLLVMLPFEVLTGHAAEAWGGRSLQPFSSWAMDWIRVALPALFMGWVGGFWLGHSRFMEWPMRLMWGWLFFLGILLYALTLHRWAAKRWRLPRHPDTAYVDEVQRELKSMHLPPAELEWVKEADTTSVNMTPLSFRTLKLALTPTLSDHFSARETALLIAREHFQIFSNRRIIALGICMAWLITGQFLAWAIPAKSLLEAALGGMAVFTLWCLAALFIWPTLNRAWCNDADAAMLDHASLEEAEQILRKLQEVNATDLNLTPGKTAVFHPIPPLNERLRALRRNAKASAAPPAQPDPVTTEDQPT